jgi:RNA polymerase sigma factor
MPEEQIISDLTIDERATQAKSDNEAADLLISEFTPFLLSRAGKSSMGDKNNAEELYSIALMAFYEAIKNYDYNKGHFFPFANEVVKRRLIDAVRKLYSNKHNVIPFDENSETEEPTLFTNAAIKAHRASNYQEDLVNEIEQFKLELSEWGITLEALVKQSPKHKALRKKYKDAIEKLSNSSDIMRTLWVKRYFPAKKASEISGLSKKNLEYARIFIIASLIIKNGDYLYLSEYVIN